MKTKKTIGTFIVYLLLFLGSLFCLFPFYWMIRTSLVGTDEILSGRAVHHSTCDKVGKL